MVCRISVSKYTQRSSLDVGLGLSAIIFGGVTGIVKEEDAGDGTFFLDLFMRILSSRTQLKRIKFMNERDRASFGVEDLPTTIRDFSKVLSKYAISIDTISGHCPS